MTLKNNLTPSILPEKSKLERIMELLEQFPSGIDYEANPSNPSPEDMVSHIAGLIYKICIETDAPLDKS